VSYRTLLRHRCTIERQTRTQIDGTVAFEWGAISKNEACFIDLTFIRKGRDPQWTPESGRPADRTGVGFFGPRSKVLVGDRVRMTRGPIKGTFMIEGAFDQISDHRGRLHHIEAGVHEVPPSVAAGAAP
jgi:hypothetical protein